MTVHCLTDTQKSIIAQWYRQKLYTQKQLAQHYMVSERTIHRVLEEKGLATPVSRLKGEAYQIMQVLKEYGMNLDQLKAALAAPALTHENVQAYLNKASRFVLSQLFYNSALVKALELANEAKAKRDQEAAHAAQVS